MRKVSGWAFLAVLLAVMGTVGFAQVSSKNANESGAPSVQATKDPKDMSRTELTTTVKRLDADLFSAYNDCELEKFGSFFPENLEFYHDQTGGGPIKCVLVLDNDKCDDEVLALLSGRTPSIIIEADGDDPSGDRQRPRRCQVRTIVEVRGRTVVADRGDQLRP